LSARASASLPCSRHRALIQRHTRHGWKTIKAVRLNRIRATATQVAVSTQFKLRLAHGTIIRALMTRAQAGPTQYGPAWSRALRV
jgi:hypothetical protein